MSGMAVAVDPLVILNTGTISSTLGRALVRHIEGVEFFAPATLPETLTVQVTHDGGTTWVPHQDSAGADITLTAAKATIVRPIACNGIRLVAGGAVAAERSIGVVLYDG